MPAPGVYILRFGPRDGDAVEINGTSHFCFLEHNDFYGEWEWSFREVTYSYNSHYGTYVWAATQYNHDIKFPGAHPVRITLGPAYDAEGRRRDKLLKFSWTKVWRYKKEDRHTQGWFLVPEQMLLEHDSLTAFITERINQQLKNVRK